MPSVAKISEQDDLAWADRNAHWRALSDGFQRPKGKHQRQRDPLVLCGHGVSLKVDKGTLLIREGFTHWPQERQETRFFKGSRDLPPRIIMVDGSGSLSFDVVSWLSEQSIPLIRVSYQGDISSVIGGSGFAMCPDKVRWQIDVRDHPEKRLAFSCDLIGRKLQSSLETLRTSVPKTVAASAIARTQSALEKVGSGSVSSIDELRIIEAVAASAYFASWQGLPLHWRSRYRHPVPDAWLTIDGRNSVGGGRSLSNRNAKHPLNAMLNYAYGVVASQVQIELIAEGYDPRRGIMHHDRKDKDALAFVFDMIEPRRAAIDATVLNFIRSAQFTGADFVTRPDGVCRLSPQLARRVCQIVGGR